MTTKTHYRKVYKSDHLGVADLEDYMEEGRSLIFTIKQVRQERGVSVAGRKGDHNIAYFEDQNIKPWVINATNASILKGFANSAFVEDWAGLVIQLYIDPSVKMKGETTGGVRIMPQMPRTEKPELKQGSKAWDNAIVAYKRDGNLDAVRKRMIVSESNESLIVEIANA